MPQLCVEHLEEWSRLTLEYSLSRNQLKRLGYFFLYQAVMNAWSRPISKLLVNTCTLDHPRALPLYQRLGFVPYSREDRYIELP